MDKQTSTVLEKLTRETDESLPQLRPTHAGGVGWCDHTSERVEGCGGFSDTSYHIQFSLQKHRQEINSSNGDQFGRGCTPFTSKQLSRSYTKFSERYFHLRILQNVFGLCRYRHVVISQINNNNNNCYDHIPKAVETSQVNQITILCNQTSQNR